MIHKKTARVNETFLHLAETMTKEELEILIKKRPSLWARFSNWLEVLPSKKPPSK